MADQQQATGSFIQQTPLFDAQQWYSLKPTDDQFRDLLVLMHQQLNQMALILNLKTTGYHLLESFNNSNQWFNPNTTDPLQLRAEFTKVINVGALGAGVTNAPHGISILAGSTIKFTYIGGSATDSVGLVFYPLPAPNGGANDIIVTVDATNVVITNNSGVNFTSAYIVLKYLEF